MCGFVAFLSREGHRPDLGLLTRMTDLLAHRGPDDRGFFVEGPVGLGFRRLSILDLAPSGHQPMTSADGRHVIVFNGEIYNYVELRAELLACGHSFRSTGDTEVLLAAYQQWGRNCLERLNGMFAFAIYDRVERRIFGARDRFGVKPLFLHHGATGTVLTSEIKALRDSGYARLEVDRRAIADYLLAGQLDSTERTFYQGVSRVAPGMAFEADATGELRFFRYWSLPDAVAAETPPANVVETYGTLFEDAVRLRMRADVPVGVLLSGGLDSTSIICAMARIGKASGPRPDLNAFCYMSPEFDESSYIEATLQQTGARLWRLRDDPHDLWADLERHLWFHDEPVHSFTSVIGYQLMRLARSHGVKVLLNGQGADEVIAGYPSYFPEYWADLFAAGRLWRALQEIKDYSRGHGRETARLQARQALLRAAGRFANRLRGPASRRRTMQVQDDPWVSDELKRDWAPEARAIPGSLEASLRHSLENEPLPLYLRVEDRNSMAHGVEVRLPFMDYRLVSLAFRLGADWKLKGRYNKFVLREATNGRIPQTVRARSDKFGFPNSADTWFRNELYQPLRDLLSSRSVRECGLWRTDVVERALEQHHRGEQKIGHRLFDVAQVCMWLEGSRRWPVDGHNEVQHDAQLAVAK